MLSVQVRVLRRPCNDLVQVEGLPPNSREISRAVELFQRHQLHAQIYNGYHLVHQAVPGAPSRTLPATLFHAAHFVLTCILQVLLNNPTDGS